MNKYFVKIPYSYSRYGTLSCFVYASDSEEAEDLAMSYDNRADEDFSDGDNDGETEFEYDSMSVEIDEEDIDPPNGSNNESAINLAMQLPCKYLKDLILL